MFSEKIKRWGEGEKGVTMKIVTAHFVLPSTFWRLVVPLWPIVVFLTYNIFRITPVYLLNFYAMLSSTITSEISSSGKKAFTKIIQYFHFVRSFS